MWLVLFDIDGTLLLCGPQIREIFASSLEAVFGTTGAMDGYQFAGRTDDGIVFDLMTGAGHSERDIAAVLPEFRQVYLDSLDEGLDRRQMRLLPAVDEVLDRLSNRANTAIGLLTGNWERGARIKLSRFDLNRFFPFGAFGDGARSRHELPPVALSQARAVTGGEVPVDRVVIVGDSTLDVHCARRYGIASLAVATGFVSAADLQRAGADWVIPDLRHAASCHPVFARPGGHVCDDPTCN